MSFILDALRKSDAERQRTVTPGLADVRYARPRSRRNIWLPILVVVLAANGVFLAVQWFGRSRAPAPPVPVAVAPPSPAAERSPVQDIRPLARESEFGEPLLEPEMELENVAPVVREMAEPDPDPGLARAAPMPAPEVRPAARPAAAPEAAADATPQPSRILPGNDLPTVEQLIGSGTLNIPMLNLDLHVFSDQPARRFVVINSRRYKEGAQINEGPTVESITPAGVVLSSQGRRFTLTRK